jgi:hypothetical protein
MWGIDPALVLVLVPIVFVGIIAVAIVGSLDEKTRGDRISKFFSIASNAAIFFTVIALLYQVIDSEEKANRDSYAEILTTYNEITQMQTDNPEVWSLIYPGDTSVLMDHDEQLAVRYTYFVVNFFERLYLLYQDGVIDDQRWKVWESWLNYSFSASPMFRNVWAEGCAMYHPDFVSYVGENYGVPVCWPEAGQNSVPIGTPGAAPPR